MESSSELLNVLDVHAGQRVLEIGMGACDMTVLLASLVGEYGRVVSVDEDEALVSQTSRVLEEQRIRNVVVQRVDELEGYPSGAPYDRILAIQSVRWIPFAWLEQLAPEEMLVGHLAGNLIGNFVRLHKRQTSGHGTFFVIAGKRSAELLCAKPFSVSKQSQFRDTFSPEKEYIATFDLSSLLENDAFLFFLQCELPSLQWYTPIPGEGQRSRTSLYNPILNASLTSQTHDGICTVHVYGDSLCWEQIERCYYRWQQRGCPRFSDFHFHMKANREYILYPATGEVWLLPEEA